MWVDVYLIYVRWKRYNNDIGPMLAEHFVTYFDWIHKAKTWQITYNNHWFQQKKYDYSTIFRSNRCSIDYQKWHPIWYVYCIFRYLKKYIWLNKTYISKYITLISILKLKFWTKGKPYTYLGFPDKYMFKLDSPAVPSAIFHMKDTLEILWQGACH